MVDRVREKFARPLARRFDAEVRGLDHFDIGQALVVGNHNGGTLVPDTFIFGDAVAERFGPEAVPYGLAHEIGLALPLVGELLSRLGAVRACHENAARIFEAGHKVMVYPGGDVDAFRPYRNRNRIEFDGRRGYVRLALRSGVPILPLVAAGAHEGFVVLSDGRRLAKALGIDKRFRVKVMPVTLSVPWGLTVGPIPPYWPLRGRMVIELLPPIAFEREGEAAAADEAYVTHCDRVVRTKMQRALSSLAVELGGEISSSNS